MGRLFSPDQQMVPCSAPNAYCDILMDLSDDISTPDFLSLRHDQQLEHAKEYSSILAEPRGSRLKARCVLCNSPNHYALFIVVPSLQPNMFP